MFYGAQVWDPVLIIAQITAVQCLFYISLGLLQWLVVGWIGGYVDDLTLRYFFDWRELSLKTLNGALTALVHILNAPAGALYLMFIVERAKKCLDFTVTCYFVHLVICCGFSGWPFNVEWWATNSLGLAAMALLGEWLCVRREMQEIPLASLRVRNTTSIIGSRLQHITTAASGAVQGKTTALKSKSSMRIATEV